MWMAWNFDKLEPPNIKLREEMANAQKNKKCKTQQNYMENRM